MSAYDAIVIGGGVLGASAAYHLVRAGARTLLVDGQKAGWATGAGAGILSAADEWSGADPQERFAALAARHYPQLIAQLADDDAGETGYAVCGSLMVAMAEEDAAQFRRIEVALTRFGPGTAHGLLSAEQARERFPPLGRVRGAIYAARGARVDGRRLAGALGRAAARRGLERRGASVDQLRVAAGGDVVVSSGGVELSARHAVIAAGAWSKHLGEQLGVRIPVEPQRGQIVHLDLHGADTRGWPIVTGLRGHYLVPWEDSRVVAGATREDGSGFRPHTTAAGVLEVLAEAVRVAPGLRAAAIREIRVGLRPASPDRLPLLGPLPGLPNVLVASGHGSTGLQQGPYSGKVIADLITCGAAETDVSIFDPGRFS